MISRNRLWLNSPPWRAALDALLVGIVLLSAFLLFQHFISSFLLQLGLDALVGPITLFVYVLRLRVPTAFPGRQSLFDVLIALALSLLLALLCVWVAALVLPASVRSGLWRGRDRYVLLAFFELFSNIVTAFVCRLGIRLLLFWNQLRRRHLLWALTHAHIMIVALGAGLVIAVLEVVLLVSLRNFDLVLLIPITLGLLVLGALALALVVPPCALFSYLVMRRTTSRIESLVLATGMLRAGNYAVRVPVTGEDEVAQLQANFNAMAGSLERSVRDLRQERDRVAALLQQRRELVANVSHELRTPVATLRGYLETTIMHWDEQSQSAPPALPTLYHDLSVMEHEVLRLQTLVEDLFALASADVGKLSLCCEPTDVGALSQRIVETAAPLVWRTSKIELVADVPPEPAVALVDALRLEQALQNLLHNAVRHTSPGGIIALAVCIQEHGIMLRVRDTGEGIGPEDLPRIWQRFYQADSARAGGHAGRHGAGLGLALVKELIEEMGGTVAVESVVSEGSCFTLRLPCTV